MHEDQLKEDDDCLTVTPCFCYPMQHRSYFNCLTILMIISLLISFLTSIYSAFDDPNFATIFLPAMDLLLLLVLLIIFYKYKKNNEYGTKLAYCFSLSCLVLDIIATVLMVVVGIGLSITGLKSIKGVEHMKPSVFFGVLFCVILPLGIYKLYLLWLYFVVIKKRVCLMATETYDELMSHESSLYDDQ